MNDQIDILLATFQGEAFLKAQLNSLLEQNHTNLRILVRDDGSTDRTLEIINSFLKAYPDKITLIPSFQRLGVKGNFSELMKHATANAIMFCDQDDVWLPMKVELTLKKMKHLQFLHGNDIPLLVHTDLQVISSDLTEIAPSFWKYSFLNPSWIGLNHLLMQNCVTGCTMMVNRNLLQTAYPVPSLAVMHDWWIALVAALFGKIAHIENQTLLYRQHGKNEVGAKKGGIWQFIKNRMSRNQEKNVGKYEQAEQLLHRFSSLLDSSQKEILQAFCSLKNKSFMKKIGCVLKYRFIPRR